MQWDWHGLWIVAKWSVSALGGVAGVTKIFEWFFRGPKIYGEIEWVMAGDERFADGQIMEPLWH